MLFLGMMQWGVQRGSCYSRKTIAGRCRESRHNPVQSSGYGIFWWPSLARSSGSESILLTRTAYSAARIKVEENPNRPLRIGLSIELGECPLWVKSRRHGSVAHARRIALVYEQKVRLLFLSLHSMLGSDGLRQPTLDCDGLRRRRLDSSSTPSASNS